MLVIIGCIAGIPAISKFFEFSYNFASTHQLMERKTVITLPVYLFLSHKNHAAFSIKLQVFLGKKPINFFKKLLLL